MLAISFLSVALVPFTKNAEPDSERDFMGYNFLIADQKLKGESTLFFKSSRCMISVFRVLD